MVRGAAARDCDRWQEAAVMHRIAKKVAAPPDFVSEKSMARDDIVRLSGSP